MTPARNRATLAPAALALTVALGLPPAPPAEAQPKPDRMVVIVTGSKEYHEPGCPVVAKAGSKVRVSKAAEATRRGLTAHDCEEAAEHGPAGDPNQALVYTQDDDNKYHRKDCEKLGEEPTSLTLDKAGRSLWPCPVCEPPIRQRKPKS